MADYGKSSSTSGEVPTDETDPLIGSNKVKGTPVYNRQGESLGEVYNFIVDKYSGKVAYAVMSFGGLLGIGESYHPLPWAALDYDTGMGGFMVDLDRSQLRGGHLGMVVTRIHGRPTGSMAAMSTTTMAIITN